MIVKTQDVELISRIANSDGVREFIDHREDKSQPMDWSAAGERASTTGVVFLTDGEDALAAFELTGEGLYQVHTMFGPRCRGRKAVTIGKDMVTWMFDHGANAVWGATPLDNAKARWFNRQVGAHVFGQDNGCELFMIGKAA